MAEPGWATGKAPGSGSHGLPASLDTGHRAARAIANRSLAPAEVTSG